MRSIVRWSIATTAVGLVGMLPQDATAQSLSFTSKGSDKPITVTAQDGLEWQQNDKLFIARGNAKAVQDDTEVTADELVAHYRPKPKTGQPTKTAAPAPAASPDAPAAASDDNGSEVYRVDAIGHVTIKTKDDVATGEAAVYDFDRKVLVMNGNQLHLTTADGTVTSHRTLQYFSNENVAVAEGDAVAVDTRPETAGRQIKADKLTAFFRNDDDASKPFDNKAKKPAKAKNDTKEKARDLIYMTGLGNVVLTTKTEVVHGDRANYNLDTGMATVEGNVKMTRDNNQLNGGYAVVNVRGGVSRVYGSVAEAKGQGAPPPARVKALLGPKSETSQAPQPMGAR